MSKLTSLKSRRPIEMRCKFGSEEMMVVFDRNALTPAWSIRIQDADSDIRVVTQGLAELLISWDVTDDAGNPLQPTAEVLAELPLEVLMVLFNEISAASVPSRAEGEVSSAPSPEPSADSTATSMMPLNGETASPSPRPLASPYPT